MTHTSKDSTDEPLLSAQDLMDLGLALENGNKAEPEPLLNEMQVMAHAAYKALEIALQDAEAKKDEWYQALLLKEADLQNIRRRHQDELTKAHKFALEGFAVELLAVVDSLEQALAMPTDASSDAIQRGMTLTLKIFSDTLKRFGIEAITPEVGTLFDPTQQEAMSMQENSTVPDRSVLMLLQKGYVLNGRVIRSAKVVVAKHAA